MALHEHQQKTILRLTTGAALEPLTMRDLRAMPHISKQEAGHANRIRTLTSLRRSGSESYLHRRLEDTRTADTVDIANAAAEGARNLSEIASKRSIRQTECRSIGQVEGIRT